MIIDLLLAIAIKLIMLRIVGTDTTKKNPSAL